MSITPIVIIAIIVLGLIVAIFLLLRRLRAHTAVSPAAGPPVRTLLDIRVTYNNKPKRNLKEKWNLLSTRDYVVAKPSGPQANLFPHKVTVVEVYDNGEKENKVYYATPGALKKLGFL
jgi:hypothetical protein